MPNPICWLSHVEWWEKPQATRVCMLLSGCFHKTQGKLFQSPSSIKNLLNGPLARYAKLRIAHAPGMPGTFSPPPGVSDPDMHHGTCVTHVPWCMPGSLTSSFLWSGGENAPSTLGACATRNFRYLVRGPWCSLPSVSCSKRCSNWTLGPIFNPVNQKTTSRSGKSVHYTCQNYL